MQARCERLHVHRAARVLVTSRYSGETRAAVLRAGAVSHGGARADRSGRRGAATWQAFRRRRMPERFTVLYVGRFYRRKRVGLLLEAAAELRGAIPNLEIRIVGNGPCDAAWRAQAARLQLANTVTWLGDVSRAAPGRRVQSRRRLLPAQRSGRLRHRAAGSHGGRVSRSWRRARRRFPKWRRTRRWWNRRAPQRWPAGILALHGSPEARAAQSRRSRLGGAVRCAAGGATVCGRCARYR